MKTYGTHLNPILCKQGICMSLLGVGIDATFFAPLVKGDEDIASKPKLKRKSLSANLTRGAIKDTNVNCNFDFISFGLDQLSSKSFKWAS